MTVSSDKERGLRRSPSAYGKRSYRVAALSIAAVFLLTGSARAAVPFQDIGSSGPLNHVYVGNELSCQVAVTIDPLLEFYPPETIPGDCGTFLATDGTLYAPDFANHDGTATSNLGAFTPFTSVSQSSVSGSGTAADPFTVITVADAGSTGLRTTQTDTYVVGQDQYRTDVQVSNTGGAAQEAILYRAGDCYLQGSDFGFGVVDGATGSVACSIAANNTPADRIEQLVPITPGSHYYEAFFAEVWSQIGSQTAFPDTCRCNESIDNGIGLSWTISIPAGGSVTRSHYTRITVPPPPRISELRFRGPSGDADEFVEIYNPSAGAIQVFAPDGSAGWSLVRADGTVVGLIPNGTTIPARGHYLLDGSAYSLPGYPAGPGTFATGNASLAADLNSASTGVALFRTQTPANFTEANRLDAVGQSTAPALYREGTGLSSLPGSDVQYSFVRKLRNAGTASVGRPLDTNDNQNDFVTVFPPTGTPLAAPSSEGSPGPENLSSPVQRNSRIYFELLDPSQGASAPPNRVLRSPGDPGYTDPDGAGPATQELLLRRRVVNVGPEPLSHLRFRVTDLTANANPAPPLSDSLARIFSSLSTTVGAQTISPLVLEQPPSLLNGGALNSSLGMTEVTAANPLGPGSAAGRYIELRFGLERGGRFLAVFNAEGELGSGGVATVAGR